MRQAKRVFGVQIVKGGKLKLIGFFSDSEREQYCKIKENHARPVTMAQWKQIPKDMKSRG